MFERSRRTDAAGADGDGRQPTGLAARSRSWYEANARRYDRLHPGLPGDVAFYARLAQGKRVLEVGAGTGRVTLALAEVAGLLVALDVAPAMVRVAASRLPDRRMAHLVAADGRALPLDGPFDLVVLPYRTVHHFDADDRLSLWSELHRVSAAGGLLAFDWWSGPVVRSSGRGGQPPTGALDEAALVRELFATAWIVEEARRGFGTEESAESRTRVWVARAAGGRRMTGRS